MNFKFFIFCCACLSGALVAVIWRNIERNNRQRTIKVTSSLHDTKTKYNYWLAQQDLERKMLPEEWISYKKEINFNQAKLETEADWLKDKINIICSVKSKSRPRAKAIKETWGQNCNSVIFWGDFVDNEVPVVELPFDNRLCSMINHIYLKYKFDWLFLTDDQTFSIIENLRRYVAPLNVTKPYYLGHPVQKPYSSIPYNILDAGIVLSRQTVSKLYTELTKQNCTTKKSSLLIDEEIGYFLRGYAKVSDTRDAHYRGRFNPFSPAEMIIPGSISVFNPYWRNSLFLSNEGIESCSDSAISFHGISHIQMHLLHYLIHSLAIFKHSLKGLGNEKAMDNLNQIQAMNMKNDIVENLFEAKSSIKLLNVIPEKHKTYLYKDNLSTRDKTKDNEV